MADEQVFTDIGGLPDVARLAHDVARTGTSRVLTENGTPVAVLSPAEAGAAKPSKGATVNAKSRHARKRGSRGFSMDDPLWEVVGMFEDPDGPTDVSSNKHSYLTD